MSKQKYLIIDSRPYGLFSIFLHTVDNIKWAVDNGYVPVVRWGPGRIDVNDGRPGAADASKYGNPSHVESSLNFVTDSQEGALKACLYYDAKDSWNGSKNPWEYYFEPLNDHQLKDIVPTDAKISDIFQIGELDFNLKNKFLIGNIHSYEPLKLWALLKTNPQGVNSHRSEVGNIIHEHISIKECIMKKVDDFQEKYFSKAEFGILGIHIRGTDKKTEQGVLKCIDLDEYIRLAKVYVEQNPDCKIFIASDTNEAIAEFYKNFPKERLIVHNCVRMNRYQENTPIHLSSAAGPERGEEALIEALLLSKCDYFICSDSNMSAFPLYYNPALEFIVISPSSTTRRYRIFNSTEVANEE